MRRGYPDELRHRSRIFATWCRKADLSLFIVKRCHLELFGARYRMATSSGPAGYRAALEAHEAADGAAVVATRQPVRNCTATSVGLTSAR